MSELFRNTLTGWQWAILAALPAAIIALYFLKLRRQPLEVPSTYLWKKSIEDLHVNSLWQRLRQSLLLFLQLLLIALAMLALLRPGMQGARLEGQRFIFLIDNSASMSATDTESGETRLEESKRLVASLVDQMESGMTAMIVSFSDSAEMVQNFTDSRRLLKERLDTIQPTVHSTNLLDALELADGLANPGRASIGQGAAEIEVRPAEKASVYIFSDGRFDDVKDFSLGNLEPRYVPIGSFEAQNLAVTKFSTRRNETRPEERQAFVQVSNFTESEKAIVVELSLDGTFLDARELKAPAGETAGVVFPLADAPAGSLIARLKYQLDTPNGKDALPLDDLAYAALTDNATGRVLVVSPGNIPLSKALATQRTGRLGKFEIKSPDYLQSDEYRLAAEQGNFDLVIYDQCVPPDMPRANTVFVGRLPPVAAWRGESKASTSEDTKSNSKQEDGKQPDEKAAVTAANATQTVAAPQILDWDRTHPMLMNVELGDVLIANSLLLAAPVGGKDLIESTSGPIAAIAPRDAYQDAVLGFEIIHQDSDGPALNTNWYLRHSFPTFWLNTVEFLAGGDEDAKSASVSPGKPIEIRVPGGAPELTVVDPEKKEFALRRSSDELFQFHDTHRLGIYTVRERDQPIQRFAVNLFDRAESDIRVRPSQDQDGSTIRAADVRIGNIDVEAAGNTPARKEFWKLMLIGALAVLVVEWYIYNRRVYV
jgi:hypothetical protein